MEIKKHTFTGQDLLMIDRCLIKNAENYQQLNVYQLGKVYNSLRLDLELERRLVIGKQYDDCCSTQFYFN